MTRANIHVCDSFFAEVPSDAYPGGETWTLLESLEGSTQAEFESKVWTFIAGWDREKLASNGGTPVGNWDYEFCWMPVKPPILPSGKVEDYHDWIHWTGRVMVRERCRCGSATPTCGGTSVSWFPWQVRAAASGEATRAEARRACPGDRGRPPEKILRIRDSLQVISSVRTNYYHGGSR